MVLTVRRPVNPTVNQADCATDTLVTVSVTQGGLANTVMKVREIIREINTGGTQKEYFKNKK